MNDSTDAPPAPDPTVCFCVNVKKSTIQAAIEDGCLTVDAIKERTRACTGCQSCRTDIDALIKSYKVSQA